MPGVKPHSGVIKLVAETHTFCCSDIHPSGWFLSRTNPEASAVSGCEHLQCYKMRATKVWNHREDPGRDCRAQLLARDGWTGSTCPAPRRPSTSAKPSAGRSGALRHTFLINKRHASRNPVSPINQRLSSHQHPNPFLPPPFSAS